MRASTPRRGGCATWSGPPPSCSARTARRAPSRGAAGRCRGALGRARRRRPAAAACRHRGLTVGVPPPATATLVRALAVGGDAYEAQLGVGACQVVVDARRGRGARPGDRDRPRRTRVGGRRPRCAPRGPVGPRAGRARRDASPEGRVRPRRDTCPPRRRRADLMAGAGGTPGAWRRATRTSPSASHAGSACRTARPSGSPAARPRRRGGASPRWGRWPRAPRRPPSPPFAR